MPNLLDLARQELKKRNILQSVQQPQGQQEQTQSPALISQDDFNTWKGNLNPADYQTALNPQEMQRFTDWAAKTNAPISDDYDMQGYWKNEIAPYAALEGKFTPEQIALARQGINGGNTELANFIAKQGIKTPTTVNEIIAAKKGQFNPVPFDGETQHYTDKYKTPLHDTFSNESIYATGDNAKYAGKWDGDKYISPVQQAMVTGLMNKVKGGLSDIASGYDDNVNNGFQLSNLTKDQTKSGWNRLGEAIGTGQRLLSNPAVQGLIAGALYGKDKGNALYGLGKGFEWMQNKAKSDYYQRMLQGDNYKPSILGNYDNKDYDSYSMANRRQIQNILESIRTDNNTRNVNDQIQNREDRLTLDKDKFDFDKKHKTTMEGIAKSSNSLGWANYNERVRSNKKREEIALKQTKKMPLTPTQAISISKDYRNANSTTEKLDLLYRLGPYAGMTTNDVDEYLKGITDEEEYNNKLDDIYEMQFASIYYN